MKLIARQGDISIFEISELPKRLLLQKPEQGKIILAHGEVTGHCHSVVFDSADWWKNESGTSYLEVKTPTIIEHQEHSEIPLNPGKYLIRRQVEYSPKAIIQVAD